MAKRKMILETVHKTARWLREAGLMDTKAMREFAALCLPPVKEYTAAQIKRIRESYKALAA